MTHYNGPNCHPALDTLAMSAIANIMSHNAGPASHSEESYLVGDMGSLVYPVYGGIEDWGYGATYGSLLIIIRNCLLYTSPSPRDQRGSRMPSSA